MFNRPRVVPRKLHTMSRLLRRENALAARWAEGGVIAQNWGDKLNLYMAQRIIGCQVLHGAGVYPAPARPVHYWVGPFWRRLAAILMLRSWAQGLFPQMLCSLDAHTKSARVADRYLTDDCGEEGLTAPDAVGDAALLLPRFYTPKRTYEHRSLRVIPQCSELDETFFRNARS